MAKTLKQRRRSRQWFTLHPWKWMGQRTRLPPRDQRRWDTEPVTRDDIERAVDHVLRRLTCRPEAHDDEGNVFCSRCGWVDGQEGGDSG